MDGGGLRPSNSSHQSSMHSHVQACVYEHRCMCANTRAHVGMYLGSHGKVSFILTLLVTFMHVSMCMCDYQRTLYESQFPGTELKLSGLVVSDFTR